MPRKSVEGRINRLYSKYCSGIQIPLMATITIMDAAKKAITGNPAITDEELGTKLHSLAIEASTA